LRAAHAPNFFALPRQFGTSLLVTTYQASNLTVLAVTVLPGRRYPDLINDNETLLESSFVVPTECLGEVAATVCASEPA
jgi:hypothetical protein